MRTKDHQQLSQSLLGQTGICALRAAAPAYLGDQDGDLFVGELSEQGLRVDDADAVVPAQWQQMSIRPQTAQNPHWNAGFRQWAVQESNLQPWA
jgi:hypothetical protein